MSCMCLRSPGGGGCVGGALRTSVALRFTAPRETARVRLADDLLAEYPGMSL